MKGMSIVIAVGSALCLMACSQSETSGQATTSAEPSNVTEQSNPAISAQQQPNIRDQAMERTDQAAFEAGEMMNEQSEDMGERVDNMSSGMNEGTNQE